jgi:methionyl-tRNA formyltransferase
MKFVAIGRGKILYDTIELLVQSGHEIVGIATDIAAPEYTRQVSDFLELAKREGVSIVVSKSSFEIDNFLRNLPPFEIGISVNHRSILKKETIGFFEYGILNLHGGDLPRYRGNACQAWAILNLETSVGICVHKMIPDVVDEGPILVREYLEISLDTKIWDVLSWMENVGPKMFLQAINLLSIDTNFQIEDTRESNTRSLRCYERRPSDAQIDWNVSAKSVLALINASSYPYSGAYTIYKTQKMFVDDASIASLNFDILAIPGQVVELRPKSIVIACKDGEALEVLRVRLEDAKPLIPRSIIKSTKVRLGLD